MKKITDFKNGITKCKKASVICIGIRKKCRTVDRQNFALGYFSVDTTCNDLKSEAKDFLIKNMKRIDSSAEIILQNHEVEIRDDMKIEKFSLSDIFNAERLALS